MKIKNAHILTKQNLGRSMIEIMGILAIIAALSAGALVSYSKAMRRHRLNQVIHQVALISTNIRAFYANVDSYETFDMETAVKFNMISEDMLGKGQYLLSPYKGRVRITLDRAVHDGPNKTAFIITYYDLPTEACVMLAQRDWAFDEKVGLIGIAVGENGEEPSYPHPLSEVYTVNKMTAPLSMTEAADHCSGDDPLYPRSSFSWKYF